MAKQASLARTLDLEPIDRLEEKVKRLVDMIVELRADLQRSAESNARMSGELDLLRAKAADADNASMELSALREERDVIKTRVAEMLEQLEGI
jgi:FtsZ-binding cell division protein ZapB